MNDSKKLWLDIDKEIQSPALTLGRYTSDDYQHDPCHVGIVAARYKFCSRMLQGFDRVLEVGCGDGFGAPMVADRVKKLVCTDINRPLLQDCRERYFFLNNTAWEYHDFRQSPYGERMKGIYLIDVIEHIYPGEEEEFLVKLAASLEENGVLLIGTPNAAASEYASDWSRKAHINLKNYQELKDTGQRYFHNVFMFGMNDEIVHTGFPQMAHFIWALCVGPKKISNGKGDI